MTESSDQGKAMATILATIPKIEENQRTIIDDLKAMRGDINTFQVSHALMQERLAQAKKDIESRTHNQETKRVSDRVRTLENVIKTKASAKLVWWIMGVISAILILVIGASIKTAFFP